MIRCPLVSSLEALNVYFQSLIFLIVGLCLLCASCAESAVQCADERCPSGEACSEGVCAPITLPTATGDLGRYTSVALHPEGGLIVATYDATYRNLVLLRRDTEGVQTRRVIDGWNLSDHALQDRDRGKWTSLALSDGLDAHLAWFDADAGALRYARFDAANLDDDVAIEVVDGAGVDVRGTHASLGVSEDDVVHIAYRDETAQVLRYAQRDAEGLWITETVPRCSPSEVCEAEGVDYGEYADLALVGSAPRIAFYDRHRGDLKLAQRASTGDWSVTVLDGHDTERDVDTGDVGRFISAAVDAKQRLGIAYYDVSRGALRYIFASGANPTPLVVDDGVHIDPVTGATRQNLVGQHAELIFDARDGALIVYLDAGELSLKQARLVGEQVIDRVTLTGLRPGAYISTVMDTSGGLLGAYGAWPEERPGGSELAFIGGHGEGL